MHSITIRPHGVIPSSLKGRTPKEQQASSVVGAAERIVLPGGYHSHTAARSSQTLENIESL